MDNYFYNQLPLASSTIVYCDGEKNNFNREDDKFNEIISNFLKLLENSYEMPAFSVALNEETLQQLSSSLWIEFCFDKTFYHSDMPYTKLLIKVEKDASGFNLIRFHGTYEGRCYYINLTSSNMTSFYDYLLTLVK